jgi:hypothetical protein
MLKNDIILVEQLIDALRVDERNGKLNKSLVCTDKQGKVKKIFRSTSDAQKEGFFYHGVFKAIRDDKLYKDYYWEFLDDTQLLGRL